MLATFKLIFLQRIKPKNMNSLNQQSFNDSNVDYDEDSEEEAEALTAAEVFAKLEEAWLNEKFSPELLEAKTEIVECIMDQIKVMEENLLKCKKDDMKICIHKMELDRIRFVLSSYLRIRLQKIQNYTAYYLNIENQRTDKQASLFSPEELKFAKEFHSSIDKHLTELAMQHMPSILQNLNDNLSGNKPDLDCYVFLRVNEDTDSVVIDEETTETGEETVDFQKDEQHIIRYQPIRHLVSSSQLTLI